ncbi:hypothetical protein [Limnohabitans sp.]|uniref:hypothetical protein n=1 Tax=Limnohabitans sp. TaxID=1907725 RepID=UPI00286EC248|nr:hypothetical protein [Limnohabitans sp.]
MTRPEQSKAAARQFPQLRHESAQRFNGVAGYLASVHSGAARTSSKPTVDSPIRRNPNDTIFDLNCGAQVTVCHSTRFVVVRGKIKSFYQ